MNTQRNPIPTTGRPSDAVRRRWLPAVCLVVCLLGGLVWYAQATSRQQPGFRNLSGPGPGFFSLRRESNLSVLGDRFAEALEQEQAARERIEYIANEEAQFEAECQSLGRLADLSRANGDCAAATGFRIQLVNHLAGDAKPGSRHARTLQQAIIDDLASRNPDESQVRHFARAAQLELQARLHDYFEQPCEAIDKFAQATQIYNSLFGKDNLLAALVAPRWIELRLRCYGIKDANTEIDAVESVLKQHVGSDHRCVLELHHQRATACEVLGQARQASQIYLDFFEQARGVLDDDDPSMTHALIMLGFALSRDGKFVDASDCYDRAEAQAKTSSPSTEFDLANVNFFRMDLHMQKGTLGEAITLGTETIAGLERRIRSAETNIGSGPSRESMNRLLAGLLQRTAKCIHYTPLNKEDADRRETFLAKKNRSLDQLIRAQEILERLNLTRTLRYVWVMRDRCEHCYMESGKGFFDADLQQAREFAETGISVYQGLTVHGNGYQMPRLLNQLGTVVRDLESPAAAMKYFRQAVDCAQDNSLGNSMLAMSLRNMAVTHHQLEQSDQAVDCLVRMIDLNSSTFFPALLEHDESEALWLTDQFRRSLYDLFEAIDVENPDHVATAFEYLSRVKGMVSRSISTRSNILNNRGFEDLQREYRKVTREITAASFGAPDTAPRQELTARKRDLVAQVRDYVSKTDAEFETRAIGQLGTLLPDGTALVECFWQLKSGGLVDTRKFFVFVVRNTDQQTRLSIVNLGPASPIDELVRRLYPNDQTDPELPGTDQTRGTGAGLTHRDLTVPKKMLKELVWDKIEGSLGGCHTVLFCGDGSLNRVAWCDLPGSRPDRMLMDEYQISHLSNTRDVIDLLSPEELSHIGDAASHTGDVAFFGGMDFGKPSTGSPPRFPPLPHTLAEIRQTRAYFPQDRITVLSGREASKTGVVEILEQARIAYFATHGVLLEELSTPHPFSRCALILSNANSATGRIGDACLSGEEIAAMDLRNLELVILSACSSAAGVAVEGEGISGLQKAFRLAGARSCLASLWKVRDSDAREFMSFFSNNLFEKRMSRAESMRRAQQQMRDAGYAPESWANWRLMGDWR